MQQAKMLRAKTDLEGPNSDGAAPNYCAIKVPLCILSIPVIDELHKPKSADPPVDPTGHHQSHLLSDGQDL